MEDNLQFGFLSRGDLRFLISPDNMDNKVAYLDCLALLQDMLSGLGSNPKHPVFVDPEHRESLFNRTLERFYGWSKSIIENLLWNRNVAHRLSSEMILTRHRPLSHNDLYPVDKYRSDLLDQYQIIRIETFTHNGAD